MAYRTLKPGQRCQLWVGGPELAEPELLFETDELLIEAPNWSLTGADLYVNGNGRLWRLPVDGSSGLVEIAHQELPDINNDHVLDPDGEHVYLSAEGQIYRAALDGGPVERVTIEEGVQHYLHGISPDGKRLAYVLISGREPGRLAIMTPGGQSIVVDDLPGHLDGPEWSADGRWIYVNTEAFTDRPGHAQLARLRDEPGRPTEVERLVVSDTVDWFPHLSPDGSHASYVVFPPGTVGHPEDLQVEVRVVSTADWSTPLQRYPLFGGQGTLNVNSWAPDVDRATPSTPGHRFAFVAYPIS